MEITAVCYEHTDTLLKDAEFLQLESTVSIVTIGLQALNTKVT